MRNGSESENFLGHFSIPHRLPSSPVLGILNVVQYNIANGNELSQRVSLAVT
jgi:hypothetical protein